MSTLSKETTEALNSTAVESPAPQTSAAPTQSSASQLHSDAVSLEVPLKVHGSKVTEAVRGAAPRTEPFEEETSSMIVFPHGGVLRMSTPVNTGQMLVLTNLKSRQDAICRVAKVRSYSSSSSYVEVEFTHRQPGFWGVYFESDAVAATTPAAPAAPASETSRKSPGQTASGPASQKNSGRDKNESTFIGIGSQEEVQPAASSTSAPSPAKPRTAGQDSRSFQKPAAIPPANIAAPSPVEHIPSAQTPAPKSQQEEEDASLASETPGESAAVGSNAAAASRGLRSLSGEAFGAHLESTTQTQQASPEGKKNGLLIAACVAVLLLAAAGAVLFLHHRPTNSTAAVAVPVQTATPPSPAPQVATPRQVTVVPAISKPSTTPLVASRPTPVPPARTSRENVIITESPVEPAPAAPAPAAKRAVPSILGALNSHPVASRQRRDGIAAPSVDAVANPGGDALAGITPSAAPSAPPSPSPASLRVSAPIQISNGAKEPRLLVRVIPQYPPLARQTHTEGDVVLQIVVDPMGNVTDAKVISGPTALHVAAAGAVKRWKYEPLEGQSGPVKMTVTIQFRL
jgi:TonB family protein